jgi:hypothetical protein
MSGLLTITVNEARGYVAVPADIDRLAVVIGPCSGTNGYRGFYQSGQAAVTGAGYGDAVDVATQIIEQRQESGTAVKYPCAIYSSVCSTSGSYGTAALTGSGTATVAGNVGNGPYGTYEAYLKIGTGGVLGVAGITLQWSLDGGRTLSPFVSLGTDSYYTIPNSNVRINFSPASADLTTLNTLIDTLRTKINAHEVMTSGAPAVHGATGIADNISGALPAATNTATRIALVNACRASLYAHMTNVAGGIHGAADHTNVITAPAAYDDATALILAVNLKTVHNAHRVYTTGSVHGSADATNSVTATSPTNGTFVAGDIVTCRTYAPAPVAAEIDAAFAALAAGAWNGRLVVCAFPMTAALAAHVTTGLNALLAVGKRCAALCTTRLPDGETSESRTTWGGLIAADFLSFTDSRIGVVATQGLLTDAMTTRQYMRSALAQIAADFVRVGRAAVPDMPYDQPMANYTLVDSTGATIGHDEGPRGDYTGLSNDTLGNRFICVQRMPDQSRLEDVYLTVPWVMYATDERIRDFPLRRLSNSMEAVAVTAGTSVLGSAVFYTPAVGATSALLTATGIAQIQGPIYRALAKEFASEIQNAGDASLDSGLVQVPAAITVSSGRLVAATCTIAPKVAGIIVTLGITLAVQE